MEMNGKSTEMNGTSTEMNGMSKYRIFQDIPFEKLAKMSGKELKEIYKHIDKEAQRAENNKSFEEVRKFFEGQGTQYFVGEEGELDNRDAVLLEIDGRLFKETHLQLYRFLLDFQFECMCKFSLQRLPCPGTPTTQWMTSYDGSSPQVKLLFKSRLKSLLKSFERKDTFCKHAIAAIDIYNSKSEKAKLKFVRLLAANNNIVRGMIVHVTFSAMDLETGKSVIYQATVAQYLGRYFLGLLGDYSNDKILAILSLSGAEEDLAAKREYFAGLPRRQIKKL